MKITCPYCKSTYNTEIHGIDPDIEFTDEQCPSCDKYYAFEYYFEPVLLNTRRLDLTTFPVTIGDLVIRKGEHEAKVYFVEAIDADGVLLVNGIKDEFYSDGDEGIQDNNLEYFYSNFRLLAKKENLETE